MLDCPPLPAHLVRPDPRAPTPAPCPPNIRREMLVQWSTCASRHPAVRWGRAPGKLTHEARATTHTYT